jgi:hypothetical protein
MNVESTHAQSSSEMSRDDGTVEYAIWKTFRSYRIIPYVSMVSRCVQNPFAE